MKYDKNWNVNTLLDYLADNCPEVGEDNEGQIVIYTGLYQTPDGGLTDEHPDDDFDTKGQLCTE